MGLHIGFALKRRPPSDSRLVNRGGVEARPRRADDLPATALSGPDSLCVGSTSEEHLQGKRLGNGDFGSYSRCSPAFASWLRFGSTAIEGGTPPRSPDISVQTADRRACRQQIERGAESSTHPAASP